MKNPELETPEETPCWAPSQKHVAGTQGRALLEHFTAQYVLDKELAPGSGRPGFESSLSHLIAG